MNEIVCAPLYQARGHDATGETAPPSSVASSIRAVTDEAVKRNATVRMKVFPCKASARDLAGPEPVYVYED